MGCMRDETLSRAVTIYIWGDHSLPWPDNRPAFVADHLGHDAAQLLQQVEALIAEIHQDPRQWFAADVAIMAARVSIAINDRHPELTDEAVEALVAHFTYAYK